MKQRFASDLGCADGSEGILGCAKSARNPGRKRAQEAGDREHLSPASGLYELQATVQQAVLQKALRLAQIRERGRKDESFSQSIDCRS
jgi:hypothetical protein